MRKVDEFYNKFAHLADYYASKIWKEGNIGMEREDIKQEMRIKLFLAIKSYAKKWQEYKETGKCKPIPIEFYLKTTMINKSRDFIKEISKADFVCIDDMKINNHTYLDTIEISKTEIKVGNQNLTELFEDAVQKRCMKAYFINNFDLKKVIDFSDKLISNNVIQNAYNQGKISFIKDTENQILKDKKNFVKELVNDGLEKIKSYLQE